MHILECPANQDHWQDLTRSLVGILTCMSVGLNLPEEQIRSDAEAICSALFQEKNKLGGLVGLLPPEVGTLLRETGYGDNRLVRKAIIEKTLNTSAAIIKSWWMDRCRRSEQGQEIYGPVAIAGLLD